MAHSLEYVRCPLFPLPSEALQLLHEAEQKKARLENAGYSLIKETPGLLVYRKPKDDDNA